jgi:SAM-dependent methyltransferase
VAWPLAEAGFDVVSLDRSVPMLAVSRARGESEAVEVRSRVRLVEGDMRDFTLPERFGLAIAPARVFQSLLTADDQARCLRRLHEHLRPGGVLALHLFDPRLDLCVPSDDVPTETDRGSVRHPLTGNRVDMRVLHRANDPLAQLLTELWSFTEVDDAGRAVRREEEVLAMRWTYRFEMRHLLELSGFRVDAEYSDFMKSPPAYAAEQVWVASRPQA